jgi:hypothetical protein
MPVSNCSWGRTLPSPDDDNNVMSSSPAPVLEGAHNCRSPEMQELLDDGRQWVNPCLPDPWLMTCGLQVQVRVCSKVPTGYPCGSLITIALPDGHVFVAANYSHHTAMTQPQWEPRPVTRDLAPQPGVETVACGNSVRARRFLAAAFSNPVRPQ